MPALKPETRAGKKELLLKAALAAFARKGFRATSMRDICSEAGVSIGGLYCHFKSKDEIVLAIAALGKSGRSNVFDNATAALEAGHASATVATDAIRALTAFIDRPGGRRTLCGDIVIMGEAITMPAMRRILSSVDRENLDGFAELFAADGEKPANARARASVLVAALYGILILSAYNDDFDRRCCIDMLERLFANERKGLL